MLLGLSEALPSLVEARFKSAKATSSLLFSPTEVTIVRTGSEAHTTGNSPSKLNFQVRFCHSLAKKPTPKNNATPKEKTDPFEDPPAALRIADIPTADPSHLLVLNKFPIIASHFILATRSNKQQTHALEQDDLEATYACLKAWQDGSDSKQRRLFAFFNSGEHSGASQPHRHLQFLPLESMREGESTSGWELLIDVILASAEGTPTGLLQHSGLPFVYFARTFDAEPSGSELLRVYNELYDAARKAVIRYIASHPGHLALHSTDEGDSAISYNLAMTTAGMVILPRRAEGTMLRADGTDIGFVALNGTTLAGTMMVKHQEEWDVLRSRPGALDEILAAIGIPRESSTEKPRA